MKNLVESINGSYKDVLEEAITSLKQLVSHRKISAQDMVYDLLSQLNNECGDEVIRGAKDFIDDND